MGAAYDSFDYPAYWIGREYEHRSEIYAIKQFLQKIKKINTVLEVGAGFGRLAASYGFRAKKVILTDPSARTLKFARQTFQNKSNYRFIHSSLENLNKKIRANSIDLLVIVRVLHHIGDLNTAFQLINRMLAPGGYLIFEFANKRHAKAAIKNLIRGNFSFLRDMATTDIRSKRSIKKGTLPFLNYHPEKIRTLLNQFDFDIIEKRSVSNIRSVFLKRVLPTEFLVFIERTLQIPFSYFDLGPSIFILARKRLYSGRK